MSVLLTFTVKDNQHTVILDASLHEQHSGSAQVTEHQVETGSNAADHVRPMSDRLTIEGLVTNTPIRASLPPPDSSDLVGRFSGQLKAVEETIRRPIGEGKTATIKAGQSLQFEQEFDRVRDVEAALSDARAAGALVSVDTSLKHYDNMIIEALDIPRDAEHSKAIRFTIALKALRFVDTQVVDTPAPKIQKVKKGAKPPRDGTKDEADATKKQSLAIKAAKALGSLL